uniref:Uncharacterized protein n=1 Tax=Gopherus agassizii TaxID=38772 RepID=A0A452I002_9SAUR
SSEEAGLCRRCLPAAGSPGGSSRPGGAMEPAEGQSSGQVLMCQPIYPAHAAHRGELSAGQLLKWIDTTACLAGQGPAYRALSPLDTCLNRVGQIIIIKAKVNRAFTTSMEALAIIERSSRLLASGTPWCGFLSPYRHFFQLYQKPIDPHSDGERVYSPLGTANNSTHLTIPLMYCYHVSDNVSDTEEDTISTDLTHVQSIELVLPSHANHHGNTFGGQIMAWMETVATISASHLCHSYPTLKSADMFKFRGPSTVGDRLVFKAIVNNTFQKSVEVGVRVEAYNYEEWTIGQARHINSAFLIFNAVNDKGELLTFPRVKPTTKVSSLHERENEYRDGLNSPTQNNAYHTANHCQTFQGSEYRVNIEMIKIFTHEESDTLSVKVEMQVRIPSNLAFFLLSDFRLRRQWDKHYLMCEVIENVNEDEKIYHITSPSVNGDKPKDFVVLVSRRHDPYIIAVRSVTLTSLPPSPTYCRSEILCAGFLIHSDGNNSCTVFYFNQVTSGVLPYLAANLTGSSKSIEDTTSACIRFLEIDNSKIYSILF